MRKAALAAVLLASAVTGQAKTFVLPAGFSARHDGVSDAWLGWRVGSGVKPNAAVVYALNDTPKRSYGRVNLNRTIVVQGRD